MNTPDSATYATRDDQIPAGCPLHAMPGVGDVVEYERDRVHYLTQLHQQHGDLVRFDEHLFFIFGADIIDQILMRTNRDFMPQNIKRPVGTPFTAPEIKQNAHDWKDFRTGLIKGLHHSRVDNFVAMMLSLGDEHLRTWHADQRVGFLEEMKTIVSRITAQYFFGPAGEPLIPQINAFVDARFVYFNNPFSLPKWMPMPSRIRLRKQAFRLDAAMHTIVAQQRSQPPERENLLSVLLAARSSEDEPFNDDFICAVLAAGLFQSGPTTVAALSWLWYTLVQHPEAFAKFYHEIDTVLEGHAPTAETIARLEYVDCVIKEVLRLYPPVWQLGRDVATDTDLKGHAMTNGQRMRILLYFNHRNPRNFKQPDDFVPERWLDKDQVQAIPRGGYIPFGSGPTKCLGASFAQTEITILSVLIAQRFRLRLPANDKTTMSPHLVLRPANLEFIIEAR